MVTMLTPLLRPLARFMLSQGVSFQAFAEAMKAAFVKEAERAGAKTDSAISVTTGLQRREVVRLRGLREPEPKGPNHLAQLVAKWLSDPAYVASKIPRSGPVPSFDALAASVRKDVHPKTMLNALLEAETIGWTEEGDWLELRKTGYTPVSGSVEQVDYLAKNTGDHLAAAVQNIKEDAGLFDRAVHYNHLSAGAVQELRDLFEDEQMRVLERINARAAALQDPTGAETMRMRAGGYFYKETEEENDGI